jgi:hypothetical protein
MFNRNNYVSFKNIPMFAEVESYTPATYVVNGENMTLFSIIKDLNDKQETNTLLDNQISSFRSTNSDSIIIQGLEAAKLGVQKSIASYQNVLVNDVSMKDFTDLLTELNDQKDPSESTKKQINYLTNVLKSKSM